MRTDIFKNTKGKSAFVVAFFALIFAATTLNAANRYSVASGNWNSTGTWSATSGGTSGVSVPGSGDNVFLENGHTVTVTAAADFGTLSFTTTGIPATLTINSGITLTGHGLVTLLCGASPGSTINGDGTLKLGGNVTVTDDNTGTTGATISTLVDLGGSTRTFTVATHTNNITYDLTISGIISDGGGSAGITKNGGGKLVLSGHNTYTGAVTISEGQVNVQDDQGLGTIAGGVTVYQTGYNNSRLELESTTGVTIGAEPLSLSGEGGGQSFGALMSWNGNNIYGGPITLTSLTRIDSYVTSRTLTLTNTINIGTYQLLIQGPSTNENNLISGVISGTGQVQKVGVGTWKLSAANTFTGGFQLLNGKLIINNPHALGSLPGSFQIGGVGNTPTIDNTSGSSITTLDYPMGWYNDFTFTGTNPLNLGIGAVTTGTVKVTVSGAGLLTVGGVISGTPGTLTKAGSGTLTLSGNSTFSGGMTIINGTLNINSNTAIGTGTFTISAGKIDNTSGSLKTLTNNNVQNWNGNFTYTGTDDLNLGTGAVSMNASRQVTTNGGTLTVGGVISGSGFGLTKAGAGTMTLTGTNTFSGGTNLNAGTLNINHSSALGDVAGTFTINGGKIDNTSAGDITTSNYPLALNGDFTYNGSPPHNLNLGTGAVSLSADRQITITAGTLTMGGILNDNTKSITKAGSGTLSFGSQDKTLKSLTISSGTLVSTSGTMNLAGNFVNIATFMHNDGTLIFNGTGVQTINSGGSSFFNLSITNTGGTCTASTNAITSAESFTTIAGSTLDMAANALSVNTVIHSGTLLTQNTSLTPITAGKTWGGTVEYNAATGGQTVVAGTYYDLIMGNTSGLQMVSGNINAQHVLDIKPGGNLTNPSGKIVTVGL
ncbi:MAG: autotransporter-associated beta strand repeat-containing protein [Bacteroidetes bacterium]|nr:autotransporter-associated beta strand repeat-containing protein [Bacteroidota bacterium]